MKETPSAVLPRGRVWVPVVVGLLALAFAQLRTTSVSVEAPTAKAAAAEPSFVFGGSSGRRVEVAPLRRGPIATAVQAPGTVQAGSEVGVSAPFEGTVLEIVRDEGDPVAEGEVVFRLDPRDYGEKVTEAEIALAGKRAALLEAQAEQAEAAQRLAEANDEPAEVTEARLKVRQSELSLERTRAQLDAAQAKLDRADQMLREGIGRQTDVESAKSEHSVASIGVRIGQEELILARETLEFRTQTWERTRREAGKAATVAQAALTRAQGDLQAAELAVARARRDLERCDVRSPLTGVVTARSINRGDLVTRPPSDTPHAIVSDLAHLLVYADVDEGDVVAVQPGQPSEVVVHALEEAGPLRAQVYDRGMRARQEQGKEVKTFRVRLLLEPGQPRLDALRPGMTASAEIETGRSADALKVPLQAVLRRERGQLPKDLAERLPEALRGPLLAAPAKEDALLDVVLVATSDGEAGLRVVDLGLVDADEAEVLAGLEADANVIVGPYRALEALADGDPIQARPAEQQLLLDDEASGVAAVRSATPAGGDADRP